MAAAPLAQASTPFTKPSTPIIARQLSLSARRQQLTVKTSMTLQEYHSLADRTMDNLLATLEEIIDSESGAEDWEVDYSSGVLTLKLGDHGTYVVNKQPPNMQIWLSSPTSGPKRYDYAEDEGGMWFYTRDGRTLRDLLETEVGAVLGKPIDLSGV